MNTRRSEKILRMAISQNDPGSPTMSSDDPIADSASEYVPSKESDISFDWENFSPHTPSDFERNDSPTVMEANCSPRSVEINKRKRIRRGHRCLFCDCEIKDFARRETS
nr:unnamed protein product [Callosobruchus analis]